MQNKKALKSNPKAHEPDAKPAVKPIAQKALACLALTCFVCATFFLIQFLLSFPAQWIYNTFSISSTLIQTVFSFFSYAISLVVILFAPKFLYKKWHVSQSDLGLNELPTWLDLGLAPVGLIIYLVIAAILTSVFTAIFPWFNAAEAQDVGFNNVVFGPDRILAFTSLVIISPIAEELIFRGFLYKKLKDTIKSKKTKDLTAIIIATLLTSLAFGIMHGQWNVGVNVFAMSLVLCALREVTGSIYSGILLHMLKNAIAFYLLYLTTFNF